MKRKGYVIKNEKGLYYNEFLSYRGIRIHKFMDTPNTKFFNKKYVMTLIAVLEITEGEICSIEIVRE